MNSSSAKNELDDYCGTGVLLDVQRRFINGRESKPKCGLLESFREVIEYWILEHETGGLVET